MSRTSARVRLFAPTTGPSSGTVGINVSHSIWATPERVHQRCGRLRRAAATSLIIPAVSFFADGYDSAGRPHMRNIAELRQLVGQKRVAVFAEITQQYRGLLPGDPLLEPYFALAEELDIPVGIHMGEGPPGGANVESYEKYRVALGNPLLLEEVLVRHPRMRVYVMHYGSPFVDDMIALMFSYPQVYVDVAQNNWGLPRRMLAPARRS